MIGRVVLSTWKKYYNYQKIGGVQVMSMTGGQLVGGGVAKATCQQEEWHSM
jgi:hypothetical protein